MFKFYRQSMIPNVIYIIMTDNRSSKQIEMLSKNYFDYLAGRYPIMCSCDEFYFFPRVKGSIEFLNITDDLDAQKINQDITYIKNLKNLLEKIKIDERNLDPLTDLTLLKQSMSSFLREFEELRIWSFDPTLYLKIGLLGLEQLISRFQFIKNNIELPMIRRLSSINRLLKQAKVNLRAASPGHLQVATELSQAAINYLGQLPIFFKKSPLLSKRINALNRANIKGLNDYKYFLKKLPPLKAGGSNKYKINGILKNFYAYPGNPREIFEIAHHEYQVSLEELTKTAQGINPSLSWQEILKRYKFYIDSTDMLLKSYSNKIKEIKKFLKNNSIFTIPESQAIKVRLTPEFLKPIRASASYVSPLTDDPREPAYFYITADYDQDKKGKRGLIKDIHNEYVFVTAHETFPGHHLLDTYRRKMKNPIRQQIEIPLFYEGWASYVEKLIIEAGFIKDPLQKMIGLKRQAWRAVRAMLDSATKVNKFSFHEASTALENLGYHPYIVKAMLRHYMLTCGYQLCYTIGKFEFERLKKKFAPRLGLKKFHEIILQGGQIPFELLKKRMEKYYAK